MNDTDKVRQLLEDSIRQRAEVRSAGREPGEYRFVPIDRKTIRYGLGGVMGTRRGAVIEILRARKEGGRSDLSDFCRRVNTQTVNRRTVEALIKAVRSTSCIRTAPAHCSPSAGAVGGRARRPTRRRTACSATSRVCRTYRWSTPDRGIAESLAHEKTALGLYLSGHPLRGLSQPSAASDHHAARTTSRRATTGAAPRRYCQRGTRDQRQEWPHVLSRHRRPYGRLRNHAAGDGVRDASGTG